MKTLDDYERFLTTTLAAWSADQRTAFAAAMAERWIPAYRAFSEREAWGDPAILRAGIDLVWAHLRGDLLREPERSRLAANLHDVTPHMDDFDADEALAACTMVSGALDCCGADTRRAVHRATEAALSGFGAVEPAWWMEEENQPRLWKKSAVRGELQKQLGLIDQVAGVTHFDDDTITAWRDRLTAPDLVGQVPRRKKSTGPAAETNQALFERYRAMMEADLRQTPWRPNPAESPSFFLLVYTTDWMSRYSRRRQTIDGTYGPLADGIAQQALVTRQRARDAAERAIPSWDSELRWWLDLQFQNPLNLYDVRSPEEPHGYGPSIRRLWVEAKRRGESDEGAWKSIVTWGRHRPAAWDSEDRRKRKGSPEARSAAALAERLARVTVWTTTADVDHPWEAQVDGQSWKVCLNDFPDDYMYSLLIDGEVIGHFHDWPKNWRREPIP